MAELPFWQLTAAFLAAMLVFIGAVALVRYSRPMMLILLGFVVVPPALARAAYAIDPGPPPNAGPAYGSPSSPRSPAFSRAPTSSCSATAQLSCTAR